MAKRTGIYRNTEAHPFKYFIFKHLNYCILITIIFTSCLGEKKKEAREQEDYNRVENGIHVRTGLKDGEGLLTVVAHCTACHSAQLIVQNRMDRERWNATIRWMQETQNLWDLGENQEVIVNYLVKNYPPEEKGRRENLKDVQWYKLEE